MIEYQSGNLLNVTSGIIVHGCNAKGVMGSGVAKAIRDTYPGCYSAYAALTPSLETLLGTNIWYKASSDLWIANAITQKNYGKYNVRYVNYAAIVTCFLEIIQMADLTNRDVHFPKIGAGLGGGDWDIIESLINDCDPEDSVRKVCWVM